MISAGDEKPSPDELLRRIESQESAGKRGRLKIFLGYAPRVGKSQRMFDEGSRRKRRGQDVVVATIQARVAEEPADTMGMLEVVGDDAIDLDRILKRRPQVCLVDELALDNPPGSRHPKRWQDVGDLLANGIHVITALNIQFIEEMQDSIERIADKRAVHSVPKSFIASADEIEVVDVPEEELVKAGGSRSAETVQQLSRLREAALCLAAEVIEGQLERYMDLHGIRQAWGTQERILVCLTARSDARAMIESGRRNADRFHGQLLAAYVGQIGLNRLDQEALDAHLAIAREQGAETHILQGADPAETLLRFAGEHRVTQIFIGHGRGSRWMPWAHSPTDRLVEAAEGMDVKIFPRSQSA
jgi:two-component system, OmpR family, sensor histidine kinase KdpD